MIAESLKKRVIKLAQSFGSKAETLRPALRFIAKKRIKFTQTKTRADLRAKFVTGKILDRGDIGAAVEIHINPNTPDGFYYFQPLPNCGLRDASKLWVQSRNPRKKNLYHGQPYVSGMAFREREEIINYK